MRDLTPAGRALAVKRAGEGSVVAAVALNPGEWPAAYASAAVAALNRAALAARTAYRCPECGQRWTFADDANEYAYGHDCESE